jgi:TetR/AcrR family transcriptional regulator
MQQRPQTSKASRKSTRVAGGGAAAPASPWGAELQTSEERNDLKRNSILRAAAHCFNKTGFHGTSMDDIAARLGVTKPALYRYVKNKHEVLFACFNVVMDVSFGHLDRAERAGGTGLQKLRAALQGYLAELIGELGHPMVLTEEGALLPVQLRALIKRRDELEHRYRALVEEGIRDGSVVACDPKLAIFALFGATNWVPKWYREGGEWSPSFVAEHLVLLITRGIAANPEALHPGTDQVESTSPNPPSRKETSRVQT